MILLIRSRHTSGKVHRSGSDFVLYGTGRAGVLNDDGRCGVQPPEGG